MKSFYLIFLCLILNDAKSQSIELPKYLTSDEIINHFAYTLSYNEKHEQANWVAYQLTKSETIKHFERSNVFLQDPLVKTETSEEIDYKGSGYDRGHLAPAADMSSNEKSMIESFYYSNISPQLPGFNRGIWKNLEALVRSWAIEYDSIYIVTGPVLADGLPKIGPNRVSVPDYYFKVILLYSKYDIRGLGFILKNETSSLSLQNFVVSIDSVEKFAGIDFFSGLANNIEDSIESTFCISCWKWNFNNDKINKSTNGIQCKAMDSNGKQCTTLTKNASGYCVQHINRKLEVNEDIQNSVSVRCSGKTQKGARCKRMTRSSNGRCYQHGGN